MESFFGIGVFELVFIFIFALIFLGPERLPEVMRQVLSFIRQVRALSSDITKQINDEFGDLGELDPRRQVKQIMDEATAPVKKELTNTAKSTAAPKANPNATPKKPVAVQPKPASTKTESAVNPVARTTPTKKSADANGTPEVENGTVSDAEHQNHVAVVKAQGDNLDEGQTIAPPSLQQETPAHSEESEAEQAPMTQRAAEEGSV
jgi:sec-independent protein translocase protein TatB